jgi:putative oxidoreductase
VEGRDVAGLALRAVIGGTMIAHGTRHGRSLEGTAAQLGVFWRRPMPQQESAE